MQSRTMAVAVTLMLAATESVSAQASMSYPPARQPGERMYLWTMQNMRILQKAYRAAEVAASTPPPVVHAAPVARTAQTNLIVKVSMPTPPENPVVVDIRGPDNSVRTFRLEAPVKVREVVVHPGERLDIRVLVQSKPPRRNAP